MTGPIPRVVGLSIALVFMLWPAAACSASPNLDEPAASAVSQQPRPTGDAASLSGSFRPGVGAPPATPLAPSPAEPTNSPPAATTTEPAPMRQGTIADSARVRFVPERIELPSGESAVVEPERTVDGVLQVPADIRHVGWWDGSAYAGDPFGSTVIAGHVDSEWQGLGFFAELLIIQDGDLITVRAGPDALTYRVVSASLVRKQALASHRAALDQQGAHRLVLITCSGQWHPDVRSYDSNLVVVADPVFR